MDKTLLSVVVLSYNTKDLLLNCLKSLDEVKKETDFEVIVVDNASSDGSADAVAKEFPDFKLLRNRENLGFAAGNNCARKIVVGKYVLFLNSDTTVPKGTIKETVKQLEKNPEIGALSCKILLPDGKLDKDSRRSFITPWIGLTHIILKFDRIFPESKYFARYWYGYIHQDEEHDVDVIQGAYLLVRKKILDNIGWFDTDYFLDGEDIDLCWRIKEAGWTIKYFPKVTITHYKGASKGKAEYKMRKNIPLNERLRFRMSGVDSMEKFYKKRMWNRYPLYLNFLVLCGIKLVKIFRFLRTVLMG